MRIATFPLPTANNDGVDQTDTHCALQAVLCDTFGGFTRTIGDGGWRSDTGKLYVDPVAIYSIATEDSAIDRARLESIALFYGHLAGQLAVMVTHANGEVVFIDIPQAVTARAMEYA